MNSPEVVQLQEHVSALVARVNSRHGRPGYTPVHWVQQDAAITLPAKLAYYAVADCCLLTATRDGMNLMPYEYIVAREGAAHYLSRADND